MIGENHEATYDFSRSGGGTIIRQSEEKEHRRPLSTHQKPEVNSSNQIGGTGIKGRARWQVTRIGGKVAAARVRIQAK